MSGMYLKLATACVRNRPPPISNPLFYEASITDTDGWPRPTRISRERSCLEGLLSFS